MRVCELIIIHGTSEQKNASKVMGTTTNEIK